ncbi:murein transglycosylase A [Sphingomonas sp. M1-B02]|uniref:murein transglycosylase A n=1 Tax=Sphingomonas sp. M1-B02 TaxID=3114300 RepID=UPI002240B76B|nr:MltA domain-containing protein [Sphingomonas sp. S6-11]UZK66272.1 MltA domain-containing protein [Sphingomonas sp. S6-11]
MRLWGAVALAALLSACSGGIVPESAGSGPAPVRETRAPSRAAAPQPNIPVRQPTAATPLQPIPAPATPAGVTTAALAGVIAGPPIDSLPITDESAARALLAYRISCGSLQRRTDTSGLTQGSDWAESCRAAASWPERDARSFFMRYFEAAQIADGKAFATGYYEPEIHGSRDRRPGYEVPIYGPPSDLVEVDLGLFSDEMKGKRIRGRVEGKAFVPYFDRGQIDEGALKGRAPVIGYAADPVEIFFLQVQGSGRLRLPDGDVMRIGYAGQNGRDYTGIGKLMRDRGLLAAGQASMQGIMAYLRQNPEEGRAIMRENKSFVFFKELTGAGPLGAMGLPVTGWGSVAVDPKFVPLGAPAFLSMDRTDATGLWIAQDTGGAIKGSNRFDTFWGAGDDARAIAGGMSARGAAWLLLPRGVVARLQTAVPAPAP